MQRSQGTCIFPDILKIASVILLHKGGDINDPHNYCLYLSYLPYQKYLKKHIANQIHNLFIILLFFVVVEMSPLHLF